MVNVWYAALAPSGPFPVGPTQDKPKDPADDPIDDRFREPDGQPWIDSVGVGDAGRERPWT